MTFIQNAFVWCCENLPWLIMAAAAAMALLRRKKSLPLMLQILGAAGVFVLALGWEIVFRLLDWMRAYRLMGDAGKVFAFLEWVCLILFVAGFCWEKFTQWRGGQTVAAVPAP